MSTEIKRFEDTFEVVADTTADSVIKAKITAENKNLIRRFIAYNVKLSRAKRTCLDYNAKLWMASRYMLRFNVSLLNVTPEQIKHYRDSAIKNGGTACGVGFKMSIIYLFLKWAKLEGLIQQNQFPADVTRAKTNPASRPPRTVLTYDSILMFRRKIEATNRIEIATVFEILLSTGMRIDEMLQLRVVDVDFNARVPAIDGSGEQSKYVSAVIQLTTDKFEIKNRLSRKVYLTPLATRLLKSHIKKFKLQPNHPLFPWARTCVREWFADLCRGITIDGAIVRNDSEIKIIREDGFADVDESSVPMDSGFSKLLKNRKAAAEKRSKELEDIAGLPEVDFATSKRIEPANLVQKFGKLHPHALRHTFCCLMYYRNYFNTRRDMAALKEMMGHSSFNSVNIYLTRITVVTNDRQWERVVYGNNDYASL